MFWFRDLSSEVVSKIKQKVGCNRWNYNTDVSKKFHVSQAYFLIRDICW